MKVYDVYKENKSKYSKYVIMIRVGIFFEVYDDDAYIVHNIMNYKVKNMKGYKRLGFPVNSYNMVINGLDKAKINYMIIDKDIVKKKFNKNNYNKYLYYNHTLEDRIDNIYKELLKRSNESSFKYLLDKIEDLL